MTERCNILSPMHAINHRLLRFLRTITLAELVQPDSFWIKQGEGAGKPAPLGTSGTA
jgi:hypothetical protein